MRHISMSVLLIALSVTLSCREAAPIDRLVSVSDELSAAAAERRWLFPALSKSKRLEFNSASAAQEAAHFKSRRMEKRKCNTATCVTQRLADYLVRSSNNLGSLLAPTNVGSYTYGKRDSVGLLSRDPFSYLQL